MRKGVEDCPPWRSDIHSLGVPFLIRNGSKPAGALFSLGWKKPTRARGPEALLSWLLAQQEGEFCLLCFTNVFFCLQHTQPVCSESSSCRLRGLLCFCYPPPGFQGHLPLGRAPHVPESHPFLFLGMAGEVERSGGRRGQRSLGCQQSWLADRGLSLVI